MKFLISVIILLSTVGCISQKDNQTSTISEVTFNAHTRGAMENINLIDNTVTYKDYNTTKTYSITKDKKEQLLDLIKNLELKSISELKAPSDKRATDAALHASLQIRTTNETYISSDFDHDNPPNELKPIIDLLRDFVK
ncbi:hypothetical protein [uncultured Tenacibaculum sp.]|uniref:hypothetical protein n=1 Tax=uncultured Tenacibaculum sp. TaxID=174713 RepID=UPI00262FD2ED|nr:hypothetical protein [uncultured Tenacibaculum sp.]